MSDSEHPITRARWRRYAPVLALFAVVAVALGTVAVVRPGSHSAADPSEPPKLAAGGPGIGTAEDSLLGASGPVKIEGTLPTSPTSAAARNLPRGPAAVEVVTALARALGLTGTPVRSGAGWQVPDGARTLQVSDAPGMPWSLLSANGVPGCAVTPKGVVPDCPVGTVPGAGDNPVIVAPGPGTPGGRKHPGGVVEPTGPQTVPAPGKPANDGTEPGGSGGGSSGSSGNTGVGGGPAHLPPDAPVHGQPVPVPGKTLPVPTKPADDDALTAARPVLSAAGIPDARTRVQRLPGTVSVLADPVVDGLVTWGYGTSVTVAADGKITGASGWLGRPTGGATYPLVGAADLLKTLAFPAIARMCGQKVCPEQRLEVTGAELGLSLGFQASGVPVLLPAWRYTLRDRGTPLVLVAVQPKYLGDRSDRPNVPGGAVPPPADPSGAANNGAGGGAAPANPNSEPATAPQTR